MQDFMDRFSTEEACRDYVASEYGATALWRIRRGVLKCRSCRRDVSITAGTVFGDSRIPLRLRFQAI